MASVVLTVTDESLLTQIKKACSLLRDVEAVKVVKNKTAPKDITQTDGYKEAMEDVRTGRVYEYASVDDFFKKQEYKLHRHPLRFILKIKTKNERRHVVFALIIRKIELKFVPLQKKLHSRLEIKQIRPHR